MSELRDRVTLEIRIPGVDGNLESAEWAPFWNAIKGAIPAGELVWNGDYLLQGDKSATFSLVFIEPEDPWLMSSIVEATIRELDPDTQPKIRAFDWDSEIDLESSDPLD